MSSRIVILILVVAFLAVIILGFMSGRAKGDSVDRLSREEQVEIMLTCIADAHTKTLRKKYGNVYTGGTEEQLVANAFFQYRTKDR